MNSVPALSLAPPGALHAEYLAFVRKAKIGWAVVVAVILCVLQANRTIHFPPALLWAVVFLIPVVPCLFVGRGALSSILWGNRSPESVLTVVAMTALSAASLIGLLVLPGRNVPMWGWWLSPLVAAGSAVVLNVWVQTRADQFGGFGILATYFAGKDIFGYSRHANFIVYALLGIPALAGGWVRMKTGSLLGCFAVYLFSEEILWGAYRMGLGHL